MEPFFRTHAYLVEHTNGSLRRHLMDEIDWNHRLIGIKGERNVGKTTFLLEYAKENYGTNNRKCLYININNFYFQSRGFYEFACNFYRNGGRTLLIDQVFKYPDWSKELRRCYDDCPNLQIVFTGSSVMKLKEENHELNGIVKSYNLKGFSFREFLELKTGQKYPIYSIEDIITNGEKIAKKIVSEVKPLVYFKDYLHHGYYPFFVEDRNYSENLLKTMNMAIEVDVLYINQIELKYLTKIKKLFYLIAENGLNTINVSKISNYIQTSRATVMNYLKYLEDARLINLIYASDDELRKKPSRIMLNNTNLMFTIYPLKVDEQDLMETFFVNSLCKNHKINVSGKDKVYLVDNKLKFKIINADKRTLSNKEKNIIQLRYNTEKGKEYKVPIWLLGFMY